MNSTSLVNNQIPISYFEAPSFGALLPKDLGARTSSATAQSTLSFDDRFALLRQHGSFTLAYSAAFQDGLEYFSTEHGFIAYRMVVGTALVLADPVTSPENCERLIRAFVKAKSDVSFCQASHPTAKLLAGMGFKVNGMGTDIRIDLTNYKRKTLRRALNRVIYPLQGHHAHKREFRGTAEQTYFAFNKGLSGFRALKMLRACGMF